MGLAGWIAPALIAAVIAAFVSVLGWFVTAGLTFRAEQRRRDEKTRDFMIALRAEIRSELTELENFDLKQDLVHVQQRYLESDSYRVFVIKSFDSVVIGSIVPELFILPEAVIDPVIVYMRQRNGLETLIAEIRDFDMGRYGREQEIELYTDLTVKRIRMINAATEAIWAIEAAS